jgi:hypothetical protein
MTFLGSRFFEKGSRSGSCADVHLSMATAAFKLPAKDPNFSGPVLKQVCRYGTKDWVRGGGRGERGLLGERESSNSSSDSPGGMLSRSRKKSENRRGTAMRVGVISKPRQQRAFSEAPRQA